MKLLSPSLALSNAFRVDGLSAPLSVVVQRIQQGLRHGAAPFHVAMSLAGRRLIHLASGTGQADAQAARQLGTELDVGLVLNGSHESFRRSSVSVQPFQDQFCQSRTAPGTAPSGCVRWRPSFWRSSGLEEELKARQ